MNLQISINWEAIDSINWEFISVIIELLNILFIVVPAVIGFIYYKVKKIKIIIINKTNGSIVIIQNISKNTVFIKDIKLVSANNKELPINNRANLNSNPELKPDESFKINIDYSLFDYHNNKKLKIKIYVYNKNKYTKRIK